MQLLDLSAGLPGDASVQATVLHRTETATVRRIVLGIGATIPPCPMQDDGLFVVLCGAVRFRAGGEEAVVRAPGAAWIPAATPTRSMEAVEASVVMAMLCRSPATGAP